MCWHVKAENHLETQTGVGNDSVRGEQVGDCTVDQEWVMTAGGGSPDAMTLTGVNMCSVK